jgi:hypothetical protein
MTAAPAEAVQVVVRAAVPLVGAVFLGWPAANLLFVYCADVLAALYAYACSRAAACSARILRSTKVPRGGATLWYGVQLALTALVPFAALAAWSVLAMLPHRASCWWPPARSRRSSSSRIPNACRAASARTT